MICALMIGRAGSRGFPNKNIANVLGRKLCEYPLLAAKNSLNVNKIYISTDCPEIKKIGQKHKVEIIDRPKNLALDNSPEINSWKHAINWYEKKFEKKLEYFISLPTTSPLRKKNDFLKAFKLFKKSKCDMLIAIYKPNHFPSFNIVKKFKKNNIKIYDSSSIVTNRQKVNNIFNIATCFYIAKRNYVMKTQNLFSGNVKGIEVAEESAFDLDTKFQLKILRKII